MIHALLIATRLQRLRGNANFFATAPIHGSSGFAQPTCHPLCSGQPLSEQRNLPVGCASCSHTSPAAGGASIPSVELRAMPKAKQQSSLVRSIGTLAVISLIALVLLLSLAITTGAGHSFDQIALALPIFFVLLFLATSTGAWLQVEDFFAEPKPRLSTSPTRAPPA
jgi:hypothetical protein